MRPATAVAAAVSGLTRCVRTFGPWRCSKLRLVVETIRSPGSPRSPLPPAHIEQPDSPQKKPASRNTRSPTPPPPPPPPPPAPPARLPPPRRPGPPLGGPRWGAAVPARVGGAPRRAGGRGVGAGADEHP